MKVAIIGSRNITVEHLDKYLPQNTTEIVSGGAVGVDKCAENFAREQKIAFTEFLPQYSLYGKRAALIRDALIADYADMVIAFWDGESHGTAYTVKCARELGKVVYIYVKADTDSSYVLLH